MYLDYRMLKLKLYIQKRSISPFSNFRLQNVKIKTEKIIVVDAYKDDFRLQNVEIKQVFFAQFITI